jgi:hypothetical protein
MPISKKSPCSRIVSSLLFAPGKAPSNPLPSKHLQLQVGASIPAFHEIHPANGRMQGQSRWKNGARGGGIEFIDENGRRPP